MSVEFETLYEDNHLLVIVKPAGLATQGVRDEPSVVVAAKEYLKEKYQKPGNVYLGIVSRIDKPVSGVLVLARTSKAAGRLSQQFRTSSVAKRYLAIVEIPEREAEHFRSKQWQKSVDWLKKSETYQRMMIVDQLTPGAVRAELRWRAWAWDDSLALLEVDLLTGRKHQIRAQLAELQAPIVGDWKYGATRVAKSAKGNRKGTFSPEDSAATGFVALHAWSLSIKHPVGNRDLTFRSPPPASWKRISQRLYDRSLERIESETDGSSSTTDQN